MKKFVLVLVSFFALGFFVPSAAIHAQGACTIPQARHGSKPTTPAPKKKAKTAPIQTAPAPAALRLPAPPSVGSTLPPPPASEELARVNALTAQALAFGYQQNAETNKLTAEYNKAHLAIEDKDANTRKFVAETSADIADRLATVEELNGEAYRKYLPQHGKAEMRDANAHLLDATLGNLLKAGGTVGAAALYKPTQVTANASQSQTQEQHQQDSQSQSQVNK